MTLQELIQGGPGGRIVSAPSRPPEEAPGTPITSIVHRADEAGPGALFCALRGAMADGHDFVPEAVARGAAAVMVERRLDVAVPQAVVPDTRLGMALAAAALAGHPAARPGGGGGHGHERQDHLDLPGAVDARGGRPALRADRDHRGPGGRRGGRAAPHDPGRARAAPALRRHARRGRPRLRDGGLVARAGPAAHGGDPVRGGAVHQPDPRPPRLPPHRRGLLPGQAGALRAARGGGRGPAGGRQRSTTSSAAAWPPSRPC